jgi:hypothetical protein
MVVSTKTVVRVAPTPPKPPACVLAASPVPVLTFEEQTELDRAHAARQAELVAQALAPAMDAALKSFDIHAIADGLKLLLEQQRGLSGCELACDIILRSKTEANGWL